MGFSKVLVIDTSVKQFLENRVFDPAYARQFPGALALAKLREFGRPRGFEVVTADVYRRRGCRQHQIVVGLSDETGNVCSKMIRRGLWAGGILMSLESPIVALRFYHLLERKAVGYQYAVLYQGAHRRLPSLVQPRTVYFPGVLITERNDVEWSRRELLVMVASNKMAPHSRRMSFDARDPLTSSARVIRRLCLQYIVKRDPMLRLADLYAHRLSAAAYFAEKGDLHLYGRYWDQPISHVSARAAVSVRSCWRGTVPNKIEVMR